MKTGTLEEYPGLVVLESGTVFMDGLKLPVHVSSDYPAVSYCGNSLHLHRLVAEVFIPNPENKPMVNHKNKNKADPHKDNLEWVTAKENSVHDFNTDPAGVTARCKKACEASLLVNSKKVTAVNVKTNVTQSFNSQSECARSLQVANTTLVNAIKNEKEINGYIVKKD